MKTNQPPLTLHQWVRIAVIVSIAHVPPWLCAQGFPGMIQLPPAGPGAAVYFGEGHEPRLPADPPRMIPAGVVPAGDVDGDGFADILCTTCGDLYPWLCSIFLIFGEADPPEMVFDPFSGVPGNSTFIHPPQGNPGFTSRQAPAGDVDGDGNDDFFIMARYLPHDAGLDRVHLVFGSPDLRETEFLLPPVSRSVTWRSSGELGGGLRSFPVAVLGDFDGDGLPEFAFSAPSQNGGKGVVFVVSWRPEFIGGPEMELEQLGTSLPGFIIEGVARLDGVPRELSGYQVSPAGDLNGDGLKDLYLSTVGGHADVIFGGRDFPPRVRLDALGVRGLRLLGPPDGPEEAGVVQNGRGAGDIDGDGYDDLVVGSVKDFYSIPDPWRVHIVWGRREFPPNLDLLDPVASGTLLLDQARNSFAFVSLGFDGDEAGSDIAAPGDVDLDGHADILIGARFAHRLGHVENGMAYLIYGGPELRADPVARILPEISGDGAIRTSVMLGEYACDQLSNRLLTGIGDFDGDGSPDIAVGAPRDDAEFCGRYDSTAGPERPRMHLILSAGEPSILFERGDSDRDGTLDISDPVSTLIHLFLGGAPPRCLDAADANDDGVVDITDPVYTLQYLFQGESPPPPPHDGQGADPTPDGLSCLE